MVTSDRGDRPVPGRDGRGRFIRTAASAKRDAEALRLRSVGHTFAEIARRVGYSHRDLARRAVDRALIATVPREAADHARLLELHRLDQLFLRAWQVAERDHPLVQAGRVVQDQEGGPLVDDLPVLAALDRLLRVIDRRCKLLGLDAPTRHEVMSLDAIDAEIARLTDEIAQITPAETEDAPPV